MPIIVVSGAVPAGHEASMGGVLVADWLEKPIDQERLLAALRASIRRVGSRRPRILHVDDDADILSVVAAIAGDVADFDHAADLRTAGDLLPHGSMTW